MIAGVKVKKSEQNIQKINGLHLLSWEVYNNYGGGQSV